MGARWSGPGAVRGLDLGVESAVPGLSGFWAVSKAHVFKRMRHDLGVEKVVLGCSLVLDWALELRVS